MNCYRVKVPTTNVLHDTWKHPETAKYHTCERGFVFVAAHDALLTEGLSSGVHAAGTNGLTHEQQDLAHKKLADWTAAQLRGRHRHSHWRSASAARGGCSAVWPQAQCSRAR